MNIQLNNQFILATRTGQLNVVNRLLDNNRVNPADNNNEAIRYAAATGHLDVVNRLLEDSRVNPADNNNNDAIMWAAEYGYLDLTLRLMERYEKHKTNK